MCTYHQCKEKQAGRGRKHRASPLQPPDSARWRLPASPQQGLRGAALSICTCSTYPPHTALCFGRNIISDSRMNFHNPSRQHPAPFCCRGTEGSRGARWQNGAWRGSAEEAKRCHWAPPGKENGTRWLPATLTERWWRPHICLFFNLIFQQYLASNKANIWQISSDMVWILHASSLLISKFTGFYIFCCFLTLRRGFTNAKCTARSCELLKSRKHSLKTKEKWWFPVL